MARDIVLGCALLGAAIGTIASLRLAAVVASTPPPTWLPEINALVQPELLVDPNTRHRAELVARVVDDPALVLSRLPGCDAQAVKPPGSPEGTGHVSGCLAIIEDGLRVAPYSGELWLAKAIWLLGAGRADDGLFDALRMSYRTAPREGWIASGRVVLGLRLYPLLPEDLKPKVDNDLALVLRYDQFSRALTAAYSTEDSLRKAAQPALERLTPRQLGAFIDLVRWTAHRS